MRSWLAIGFLLPLAGCITNETNKDAARQAYSACTMAAVARLDDGRSDPASVAMGVAGACAGQYAMLSDTMQGDMITVRGQNAMRDQMQSNELRLATAAVLTYRAAKRPR